MALVVVMQAVSLLLSEASVAGQLFDFEAAVDKNEGAEAGSRAGGDVGDLVQVLVALGRRQRLVTARVVSAMGEVLLGIRPQHVTGRQIAALLETLLRFRGSFLGLRPSLEEGGGGARQVAGAGSAETRFVNKERTEEGADGRVQARRGAGRLDVRGAVVGTSGTSPQKQAQARADVERVLQHLAAVATELPPRTYALQSSSAVPGCICVHIPACTHARTHARTQDEYLLTHTHTCTLTHTHTHTHTDCQQNQILSCLVRGDFVLAPPDKTRTVYADTRMNACVRACIHACIHTSIRWIGGAGLDRTVLLQHLNPKP